MTVSTAAGPITVASHLAGRFQALISDFVAAGYKPRSIGCAAHGGHVANSRHYQGAACDFDQRGWGKTTGFMHQAHAIIAKHGFRDGCSFGDCGHVDDGQSESLQALCASPLGLYGRLMPIWRVAERRPPTFGFRDRGAEQSVSDSQRNRGCRHPGRAQALSGIAKH